MVKFRLVLLCLSMCTPLIASAQDEWGDAFDNWNSIESEVTAAQGEICLSEHRSGPSAEKIAGVSFAVLATLLAGFAVRFPRLHVLRPLFLLTSVVFLGFYLGGCPCPIKGFESLVGLFNGESIHRLPLILLGSALVLTPLLGPVWCGWVCHLGGFQEFLYRKNLLPQPGPKISNIFVQVRRIVGISFILWMVITAKPFWEPIDPFRSAFNLIATHPVSWVLLIAMLLSSLFIYRPFCRTFCPVGMLIGELNRISFAAKIRVSEKCVSCKRCSEVCGMGAIQRGELNQMSCIACGACVDACRKQAIHLSVREPNSQIHES